MKWRPFLWNRFCVQWQPVVVLLAVNRFRFLSDRVVRPVRRTIMVIRQTERKLKWWRPPSNGLVKKTLTRLQTLSRTGRKLC